MAGAVGCHGPEAVDAGRGLFRTADDVVGFLGERAVDAEDEVGPVVQRRVWRLVDGPVDTPVEVFGVLTVPSVDLDTCLGEGELASKPLGSWARGGAIPGGRRVQ